MISQPSNRGKWVMLLMAFALIFAQFFSGVALADDDNRGIIYDNERETRLTDSDFDWGNSGGAGNYPAVQGHGRHQEQVNQVTEHLEMAFQVLTLRAQVFLAREATVTDFGVVFGMGLPKQVLPLLKAALICGMDLRLGLRINGTQLLAGQRTHGIHSLDGR